MLKKKPFHLSMKRLKIDNIVNALFPHLPTRVKNILYYRFLWNGNFPEIIHIENTNVCNAECIMCPREKMARQLGFMDFELFRKIIDECAKERYVQEVHLHGFGEPLLEKDLLRKVSYAKEKGIRLTYIVTNGSLLFREVSKKLILAGLDRMKISFYGATKKTYETVHLGLDFNQVERNVRDFFSVRGEMGRDNPSIYLQFLPQKENIHERELFREKWSKFIDETKGDRLSDYRLHNYGIGRDYNILEADNSNKRGCVLPFTTMQILWNGDVVPCCFDFNADMILTNIKEQSLKEAWNSSSFADLRRTHRMLDFKTVSLCAQCDQIVIKNKIKKREYY